MWRCAIVSDIMTYSTSNCTDAKKARSNDLVSLLLA